MTILATDNFNRANGSLGSNWTLTGNGGSALQIVSQTVEQNTVGGNARYFYNAASAPNDQSSSVVFVGGTVNAGVGATVRHTWTGTLNVDSFYVLYTTGEGAGAGLHLHVTTAGSTNPSLGDWTVTLNSGDVITLQAQGTTLTMFQNSTVVGTVTDATLANGQLGILEFVASGSASDAQLDSWAGANLLNASAAAAATAISTAAFTNYASVTLAGTLYTGKGGILDGDFWLDARTGDR